MLTAGGLAAPDVSGLPDGFVWRPGTVPADSASKELAARLKDAGWLEAVVRIDTTPTGSLRLVAIPGERSFVEHWQLKGSRDVAEERIIRELPRDVPLATTELEAAVARVLVFYESRGYPLATVGMRRAEPVGPQRYLVTLDVEEGDEVRVEYVEFAGADRISRRVLKRSTRFRSGPWQPRAVKAWQRNLEGSGLVQVLSRELVVGDRGYGVRFSVRAERANRVFGAVGYDAAASELAGFARLRLANILNTGRRLGAAWESYRGLVRYELDYTEPWLFGTEMSVGFGVRHRTQDTTAALTELELDAGLPVTTDLELLFGTGYEQVAGQGPDRSARTAWVATGLNYDTRSSPVNPDEGAMVGLRTRAGTRRGGDASHFVGRMEADLLAIGPRPGRLVLENRLQGRTVETAAELSDIELYRVGGAATVRGYREGEFAGRRAGWWNCELRYPVVRGTAAYGFFDAGLVETPVRLEWLPGYGVGARVGTRVGGFEAGYGLAPGVPPLSGKLHFRFEGEF